MLKTLWRRERHQLNLPVEFFNSTNHPNFQIPVNLDLYSANLARIGAAGQITTTTTPARQVQLVLRYQW